MTASKQKGTAAETQLRKELEERGIKVRRTPASSKHDLERVVHDDDTTLNVLATRPDRGQWLCTMSLDAFAELLPPTTNVRIEVKRYTRFQIHRIFEEKFGS